MGTKFKFVESFREHVRECTRCGFCQADCPVYGASLRPALNARGKMLILQELLDDHLDLTEDLGESLFQCTTCASCSHNCRSRVPVPEIIKAARKDLQASGISHPAFNGMHQVLAGHSNIYAESTRPDLHRPLNRKAAFVFFAGCVGLYRETTATAITLDLLDRLAVDYTLIDEACCSGALDDLGFELNGAKAGKNLDLIMATGARTILTACPYCARTFNTRPAYRLLEKEGVKVIHLSQFLKDYDFGVQTSLRVTYHDPCDLGRHTGTYEEPRTTIKKIAPNFVEMAHNRDQALCCGAGGGMVGAFPRQAIAMARRRLEEAEQVGAEVLLVECNSCLQNLTKARKIKQKIKIYPTTTFISRLLAGETG